MEIRKHKMTIRVKEVQSLIEEKFRGNISWFAEEIGIDKAYLSELLRTGKNADSYKACVGIISYCDENELNFKNYIKILHVRLKKINQKR